jgi:hypothetical protein
LAYLFETASHEPLNRVHGILGICDGLTFGYLPNQPLSFFGESNGGSISLIIGLCFLGIALLVGELAKAWIGGGHIARVIGESLHIGGWVAMWHPMEIFLYEWWPLLGQRQTYELLSKITVRIAYAKSKPFPPRAEFAR